MKNINWNDVQEESARPLPGGYIAKIVEVEDNEQKECLFIKWDFANGPFKGANRATYDSFGFWPTVLARSYKQSALKFFKAFKTALEETNRGYVFRNDPQSLVGKFIGVVLAEEQYYARDGQMKTRLYVAQTRSGRAIEENDYFVPPMKPAKNAPPSYGAYPTGQNKMPSQNDSSFAEEDDDLPF